MLPPVNQGKKGKKNPPNKTPAHRDVVEPVGGRQSRRNPPCRPRRSAPALSDARILLAEHS